MLSTSLPDTAMNVSSTSAESLHLFLNGQSLPSGKAKEETFYIFRREDVLCRNFLPPSRRDFYKVTLLLQGGGKLSYANREYVLEKNTLLFSNPMVPYAWQAQPEEQTGYFATFTEIFLRRVGFGQASLLTSPLFKPGGNPVFQLTDIQAGQVQELFEKILQEYHSDYAHRFDLIRSYLQIILLEALKLDTPPLIVPLGNSAHRITDLFLELLERQFPVDEAAPFRLNTPGEFVSQLSLHVNHLNRTVKTVTGKTTTQLIRERLVAEAIILLKNSHYNVAQIGWALGFDDPAYFNNFFKKATSHTPAAFR